MVYMDMDILDAELNKVDISHTLQTQKDIDFMINVLACDKDTLENCSETSLLELYSSVDWLMNVLCEAEIPDADFTNIQGKINREEGMF